MLMRVLDRLLLVSAVAFAAACGVEPDASGSAPDEHVIERGRAASSALIADARGQLTDERAIALGYLERLRLGLGSPFRLADFALADPRLDEQTRRRVALAILARTYDRQGYHIDASALDRIGDGALMAGRTGTRIAPGAAHLALIESAVREARDPRAGELAVRLAYALAAAEGAVSRVAPTLAAQAAAVVRDRELARDDVQRLVRSADRADVDPLFVLPAWRASRYFLVEQPLATPVDIEAEAEAIALAGRLAEHLRGLEPEPQRATLATAHRRSLLNRVTAAWLAALGDATAPPQQAPIAMAVQLNRAELLAGLAEGSGEAAAVQSFLASARDEERFAAEHTLLGGQVREATRARVALTAAVAMRTFAQEEVWFPGQGGPSAGEVEARFGLARVTFDDDIPASWRAYYRRQLALSLTDLQRVLPSLNVRGLAIHIGELSRSTTTLAMHDPSSRTLYLPPGTGAGTLAHELAHDLDWQVALRRFRVRGDYATDRATRQNRGVLAARVRDLSAGLLEPPAPGSKHSEHARRPAEVFARSVDFMTTLMLAREGRMNGYLSSVQDGVLTGYGSVRPPDFTGKAGDALVGILDEVAPLPVEARRWYLDHYGTTRAVTAHELVRIVLEAEIPAENDLLLFAPASVASLDSLLAVGDAIPATRVAGTRFDALADARDAALDAVESWICGVPGAAYDRELQNARRGLVLRAATARARGIALNRAGELAGSAGRRWVAREFFGEAWPTAGVDSATARLLGDLIARTDAIGSEEIAHDEPFRLVAPPQHCAAGLPVLGR